MSGSLKLDWVSTEAARYACKHWHYARSYPFGRTVRIGVFEADEYIGAIVFAYGTNRFQGNRWNLDQRQVCELVRVALREHVAPVSEMVARALKMLRKFSPGMRLVVSYSDPDRGHHGGIYQAGNWIFVGQQPTRRNIYIIHGKRRHNRGLGFRFGSASFEYAKKHLDPDAEQLSLPGLLKYLYPLDRGMRRKVAPSGQPYPSGRAVNGDHLEFHSEEAGSIPAARSNEWGVLDERH